MCVCVCIYDQKWGGGGGGGHALCVGQHQRNASKGNMRLGKCGQVQAFKADNSYKLWYVLGLDAWPNWSLWQDGFLFSAGQSCGRVMHALEAAGLVWRTGH